MYTVNINADVGEGSGNDNALMPMLASCSIACGGHYGNVDTMRTTVRLAKKYDVKVGAHPSFPDVAHFGRKRLTITKSELQQSVYKQIMTLKMVCDEENVVVHHIKPHGALYNYAAIDAPTADAIVDAILTTKLRPNLYTLPDSILYQKAKNLLPVIPEAFIDRRYKSNLQLMARTEDGAIIHAPSRAWEQLQQLLIDQKIHTTEGFKKLSAQTFCIHGDHKNSVAILNHIKNKLSALNYKIG